MQTGFVSFGPLNDQSSKLIPSEFDHQLMKKIEDLTIQLAESFKKIDSLETQIHLWTRGDNVAMALSEDLKFCYTKIRSVKTPARGTGGSAGIDLFVPDDFAAVNLHPHLDALIPAGIKIAIPAGTAFILFNKSGVATKMKLDILAAVCDSDYQGEVHIHVMNTGERDVLITPGMKLAQGLLIPVSHCKIQEFATIEELYDGYDSERGAGGFGSTGN